MTNRETSKEIGAVALQEGEKVLLKRSMSTDIRMLSILRRRPIINKKLYMLLKTNPK